MEGRIGSLKLKLSPIRDRCYSFQDERKRSHIKWDKSFSFLVGNNGFQLFFVMFRSLKDILFPFLVFAVNCFFNPFSFVFMGEISLTTDQHTLYMLRGVFGSFLLFLY